jgi:IS605 OrfB family transposase
MDRRPPCNRFERRHPEGEGGGIPRLLKLYLSKRFIRIIAVDINVEDVTIGVFEVRQLIRPIKYIRTRRPIGKLLFIRKVNRLSMRVHRRPATSWLRYGRNIENDWINKTVGLIKKLLGNADAIVIEDLTPKQLRRKLKSKNPEKTMLFQTWPLRKIMRRINTVAARTSKLQAIPPQYTSSICPNCDNLMHHEDRRWERLYCTKCGFRDDRDHVAIRNITRTALLLNGFHYLDTFLGQQLKSYKQSIDRLTPVIQQALTQDPEIGPATWRERGGSPPQVPRVAGLGVYLGGGS